MRGPADEHHEFLAIHRALHSGEQIVRRCIGADQGRNRQRPGRGEQLNEGSKFRQAGGRAFQLLNVSSDADHNRTEVTFVGSWQTGVSSTDKYGSDYRFTSTAAGEFFFPSTEVYLNAGVVCQGCAVEVVDNTIVPGGGGG